MPTVQSTTGRVTREEYRRLEEGPPYYELIDGELVEMGRPKRKHNRLALRLGRLWDVYVERAGGGDLQYEPDLYLPGIENVYHPDFAFVTPQRVGIVDEDGVFGVPNVVCEILSPTTERLDRGVKLRDYRTTGVPHVWLIDPANPVTVEEYVLGSDGNYHLHAKVSSPTGWTPVAFPDWTIPLAELDKAATPLR
jgi:Uma2 family endonuclease